MLLCAAPPALFWSCWVGCARAMPLAAKSASAATPASDVCCLFLIKLSPSRLGVCAGTRAEGPFPAAMLLPNAHWQAKFLQTSSCDISCVEKFVSEYLFRGCEVSVSAIASKIDCKSGEFRANQAAMRALIAELESRGATAAEGGPPRARERHLARGKLLPRQRVMTLIDSGTPFLELSPLAANDMYEDAIHGAGLITGIGRVVGRECVIVCNDSTIK